MKFVPSRLVSARETLGINKSEAARMLNMSAMGYGRYENGQRVPSFQTLSFIAQTLETSVEYLCGETEDPDSGVIVVSANEEPELFELVCELRESGEDAAKRLLRYLKEL